MVSTIDAANTRPNRHDSSLYSFDGVFLTDPFIFLVYSPQAKEREQLLASKTEEEKQALKRMVERINIFRPLAPEPKRMLSQWLQVQT
jgi:hypothetical protein